MNARRPWIVRVAVAVWRRYMARLVREIRRTDGFAEMMAADPELRAIVDAYDAQVAGEI